MFGYIIILLGIASACSGPIGIALAGILLTLWALGFLALIIIGPFLS